jgi:uncharacterized protein YecT (DUF1311 family)
VARKIIALLVLLITVVNPAMAQTQDQLNTQACAARDKAEKQLQKTIASIKSKWKDDAVFLAKFETAQDAWRKFADAQFQMIYPAEDKTFEYGSVYPMCACSEMASEIRDRIRQLQPWTTPRLEGDVCPVGSR